MNTNELKNIEVIIQEEILKTEASITSLKELTKPIAPENAIGRVSRMDAINNKSVNEAAIRKAEQKLKNLLITKSNLYDPEFGICALKLHGQRRFFYLYYFYNNASIKNLELFLTYGQYVTGIRTKCQS